MIALSAILSLLLVVSTHAQQDVLQASPKAASRTLQPWLLGLTAMVVFLFIVFVLLIVNRVWCKKYKEEYNDEENRRERVNMNIYENCGLDEVEDKKNVKEVDKKDMGKQKGKESDAPKVTVM